MQNGIDLVTPMGRIIWGSVSDLVTHAKDGTLLTKKDKVTPHPQIQFGVAIPKSDPEWAAFGQAVRAKAAQDFPQGESQLPGFSWKILDGDNPAQSKSEHGRGCWILRLKTGLTPVPCFGPETPVPQAMDPASIYRGCWVRCRVQVAGNGPQSQTKGVYISPSMVQLCYYGDPIQGGPPPEQVFTAPIGPAPPGASATPVAPSAQMPPAAATAPPAQAAQAPAGAAAPAAVPQVAPPAAGAAAPQAGAPVAPAAGFAAGPPAQPQGAAPAAPAAAPPADDIPF